MNTGNKDKNKAKRFKKAIWLVNTSFALKWQ